MTFALDLAERIHGTLFEKFDADAIAWAKATVRDTIAVGIAGADTATAAITRKVTGAEGLTGPCQIIGTPYRRSADGRTRKPHRGARARLR
jgi:2-methylcitrate dehydratase PrpD